MRTRLTPPMLIVTMLAFWSACAKPDWIQQTLVTVDVTGTWRNTEGTLFELALDHKGSKVNGSVRLFAGQYGMGNITSGEIEGTVSGDVFRFNQTTGTLKLTAEMTVSGDEMTGFVKGVITGGGRRTLHRTSSSPRPASQ